MVTPACRLATFAFLLVACLTPVANAEQDQWAIDAKEGEGWHASTHMAV